MFGLRLGADELGKDIMISRWGKLGQSVPINLLCNRDNVRHFVLAHVLIHFIGSNDAVLFDITAI